MGFENFAYCNNLGWLDTVLPGSIRICLSWSLHIRVKRFQEMNHLMTTQSSTAGPVADTQVTQAICQALSCRLEYCEVALAGD